MLDDPVGELIPPCDKMLFRQIHPDKFTKGKPGSGNFVPTPGKSNFVPEDKLNLSTRREEVGPEGAHQAHVGLGRASAGTWGFTVRDAEEASSPGLSAYNDEGLGEPPLPTFHVSVRFPEDATRGQLNMIAKQLHAAAKKYGAEGWLYRA